MITAIDDEDSDRAVREARRMVAFYLIVKTYDPDATTTDGAHRRPVVTLFSYAAAVALALELTWTVWTPILGLGMSSWFTGEPGGWIGS